MSNDTAQIIESLRNRIDNHEMRLIIAERQIENDFSTFRTDMQKLCDTLADTERTINAKLDILLTDYHKRSGQKEVANWVPTLLQTAVLAITIFASIKYGVH